MDKELPRFDILPTRFAARLRARRRPPRWIHGMSTLGSLAVHAAVIGSFAAVSTGLAPAPTPPVPLLAKGDVAVAEVHLVRPGRTTRRPRRDVPPPVEAVPTRVEIVPLPAPAPPIDPQLLEPDPETMALLAQAPTVEIVEKRAAPSRAPAPPAEPRPQEQPLEPASVVVERPPDEAPPEPESAPVTPNEPSAPQERVAEAEAQPSAKPGVEKGVEILRLPTPRYPASCRRRGQEGVVVLEVLVLADGRADRITVVEQPPHEPLVEAAIDAVRRATFRPATRDGRPVPATVLIPFRFQLK